MSSLKLALNWLHFHMTTNHTHWVTFDLKEAHLSAFDIWVVFPAQQTKRKSHVKAGEHKDINNTPEWQYLSLKQKILHHLMTYDWTHQPTWQHSVNQPFCVCLNEPKMTCTVTLNELYVCSKQTQTKTKKDFLPSIKCVCFQLLKTGLACSHVLSVLNSCSHVNAANSVLLKLQANPLHSRSDSCQHKYTHLLLCGGISSPPHFLCQRNFWFLLQRSIKSLWCMQPESTRYTTTPACVWLNY